MKTTLAGHPLHPQLIVLPLGLLPFSFAMDLAYHATGKETFADAAYHTMAGGSVGGLMAGAAGAVDYLALPKEGHLKQIANTHALLNLGVLGLYAVNLASRGRERQPNLAQTLLSGACTAGLIVSGWYGAHLVYSHGVRVKGQDPIGDAPEMKPPGDPALEHGFEALEQPFPEQGPHYESDTGRDDEG